MRARVARFTAVLQALLLTATLILPALTSAAVWTDQADYAPGSVVTISGDNSDGAGYLPSETIDVVVTGPNGYSATCSGEADESGAWSCSVTLWASELAEGVYQYTATGTTSGYTESASFTDNIGVTINSASFVWHRNGEAGTGFNVSVSGTYTCTSGGGNNSCTTVNSITVTVPGITGSKAATILTSTTWSATLQFRSSGGDFSLPPADGKYGVSVLMDGNQVNSDPSDTRNNFFGADNVAPVSTVLCNNNPCAGLYAADVNVRLSASDPGSANTFSGVASTAYCIDLTNTCAPGTAYPGGGGTSVPRVAGATKYVRFFATDTAGNAETLQSQAIAFTEDDEPPSVQGTSPTNGAVDVPVDANIVITFDEDVTVDTANGITVACPTGTPISGVISGSGDEWTFNPTSDLPASTVCTVTVHSNQVEDVDLNDPPNTMDNPNYVFSFTTASANTPPTVDAGGPYSGAEGSPIDLDGGSANDPDGDPLSYLWTLDDYNSNMDAGGSCSIANETSLTLASVTCDDDSNASTFTVRLTVNGDPDGPVSDTAEVSVANVAPTVSLDSGNDLSVAESTAEVTYNYSRDDAGDNDVLTSYPSCGAYGTYVAASDTGSSFKCKFLDGGATPPGTDSDVSIYVTDDESVSNASTTATQTVNISNANPVVAAPSFSETTICQGSQATLTGISFSDAGTVDYPWSIVIDWADGSLDYSANVNAQGAQSNVSPTYNIPGTYTATVTVTDKDGGSGSNTSTNTVTVIAHYSVTYLQPVDGTIDGTVSNAVKLGRVVPVKILIWDNCANDFAGGWVTDPATIVRIRASLAPASGGTLLDSVEQYADAGSANNNTLNFRWTADATKPGGGFWIYNLDTKNFYQQQFVLNNTYRIDASIGGMTAIGGQYALLRMQK